MTLEKRVRSAAFRAAFNRRLASQADTPDDVRQDVTIRAAEAIEHAGDLLFDELRRRGVRREVAAREGRAFSAFIEAETTESQTSAFEFERHALRVFEAMADRVTPIS